MQLLLALALLQASDSVTLAPIYHRKLSDSLSLRVRAGENDLSGLAHRSQIRVELLGPGQRLLQVIAVVTDTGWYNYRVLNSPGGPEYLELACRRSQPEVTRRKVSRIPSGLLRKAAELVA